MCARRRRPGAPGLLVGMDDDTLKWAEKPQAQKTLSYARDLGIRAVRVTVPWHPGDTRLGVDDRIPVDRMILATWAAHFRVVLAVYGAATDAPQTDAARDSYCTFVGNLLRRYPGVVDVVIWNEPNTSRFWRPQFDADGQSVGPAQYEALLADCYDVLHRVRPNINVIAASSPRGNNRPCAVREREPLADRVLPQDRRRPTAPAAAPRRSSTRSGTTRTRRPTRSGRGRAMRAGRSARATTTS